MKIVYEKICGNKVVKFILGVPVKSRVEDKLTFTTRIFGIRVRKGINWRKINDLVTLCCGSTASAIARMGERVESQLPQIDKKSFDEIIRTVDGCQLVFNYLEKPFLLREELDRINDLKNEIEGKDK